MTAPESLLRSAISADSHVTEPPNCYIDHIERKYRDTAPHVESDGKGGDTFVIEGLSGKVPYGLIAAAGKDPAKIKPFGVPFSELHKGGWDGKARLADQDRDGVKAEVIYPSVGMMICNHPDADYKQACFWAYNRWLAEEFISAAPDRLIGLGQTAVRSVKEAIEDFKKFKAMGFKGVMLPGTPATSEDYHDPAFDPLWATAVELDLPVSFHILTTKGEGPNPIERVAQTAGEATQAVKTFAYGNTLIMALQNIMGQFVFGRVFERHPKLKVVLVEADAGWIPHFIARMNHAFTRHGHVLGVTTMQKMPGDYFLNNIYITFQSDMVAWRVANLMNPRRLMWANDFPHADATWPWSQDVIKKHSEGLSDEMIGWIIRDNVKECYNLH